MHGSRRRAGRCADHGRTAQFLWPIAASRSRRRGQLRDAVSRVHGHHGVRECPGAAVPIVAAIDSAPARSLAGWRRRGQAGHPKAMRWRCSPASCCADVQRCASRCHRRSTARRGGGALSRSAQREIVGVAFTCCCWRRCRPGRLACVRPDGAGVVASSTDPHHPRCRSCRRRCRRSASTTAASTAVLVAADQRRARHLHRCQQRSDIDGRAHPRRRLSQAASLEHQRAARRAGNWPSRGMPIGMAALLTQASADAAPVARPEGCFRRSPSAARGCGVPVKPARAWPASAGATAVEAGHFQRRRCPCQGRIVAGGRLGVLGASGRQPSPAPARPRSATARAPHGGRLSWLDRRPCVRSVSREQIIGFEPRTRSTCPARRAAQAATPPVRPSSTIDLHRARGDDWEQIVVDIPPGDWPASQAAKCGAFISTRGPIWP